jgi:hypothetical protein
VVELSSGLSRGGVTGAAVIDVVDALGAVGTAVNARETLAALEEIRRRRSATGRRYGR